MYNVTTTHIHICIILYSGLHLSHTVLLAVATDVSTARYVIRIQFHEGHSTPALQSKLNLALT